MLLHRRQHSYKGVVNKAVLALKRTFGPQVIKECSKRVGARGRVDVPVHLVSLGSIHLGYLHLVSQGSIPLGEDASYAMIA